MLEIAYQLISFAAASGDIDPRGSKVFRDGGDLFVNLDLILRNRGLLALHFPGDSQNLLHFLLDAAWSFRGGREGDQGEEKESR